MTHAGDDGGGFSAQLRADAADIFEAQWRHPLVRGISDGSLDKDVFRFWIRQDYLFLIEYSRLLALASARAPDLDTMTRFAELLTETLREEMALHRSYCADMGISLVELEREELAPTTRGYTDFMLRTATVGDFAELLAALLPCMWGFNELGLRMREVGAPDDEHYVRWIDMYASEEFTELVDWLRTLTDRIGAELAENARARMREVFCTSSRYELAFWDMAWRGEQWPKAAGG